MTTIQERSEEIVEEFELFDDWMGRYEHLIEIGRSLPPLDAEYKIDAYRIPGCQSQVWLVAQHHDGAVRYRADSDAMITKGLIALLIRVLDGQPAADVSSAELGFLDRIGMNEHLSSTRKNGLSAMLQRMREFADAFANSATS